MLRSLMLVTAAGALTMVPGVAVAQTQCGGIWAARCNVSKGPKTKSTDKAKVNEAAPAANASANAAANADENSAVAGASPPKASATGVANANPNSAAATDVTGANANGAVVAGAGSLGATALAAINPGQTVKTSDGAALGTVSKVVNAPDGSISQVIVTSAEGRSFPVAASKLSVAGGVVIVTDSGDR